MTRQRDVKKSKFPAITALQTTDYLDFVRNGQNLKISVADFLTAMGVTGTLQTKGEITSIPVLDVDADINYIRNIGGGAGILVSESPQDGIDIDHNFDIDKTGAAVIINENADSPTVRSIVAGTGISVGASGDVIQITNTAAPGTAKTVFVYEEADFPAAVAGVITLLDDTEYRLLNDVTTVNRFVMGNNTIIAASDERLITLTYTGSGTMITAADEDSITISNITLTCSSGTAFAISSTTGTHISFMTGVLVNCGTIGTITGMALVYFRECVLTAVNDGLTLAGTGGTFNFSTGTIQVTTGTGVKGVDFGVSVWNQIVFSFALILMADATSYCISGAAASANLSANGFGHVVIVEGDGTSTFLENISPYDDKWEFALNANAINSKNLALATHAGATITIAAANTPVIVGATWTQVDNHRFTGTSGGRWTYTGKGAHLNITAEVMGERASGGTDTFAIYAYINGAQITASSSFKVFDSVQRSLTLVWNYEFATNDYLELWIENQTGIEDFVVEKAIMRVCG